MKPIYPGFKEKCKKVIGLQNLKMNILCDGSRMIFEQQGKCHNWNRPRTLWFGEENVGIYVKLKLYSQTDYAHC